MPDEQNGTREKVGEIRGQLSALLRQLDELATHLRTVEAKIDGVARAIDAHLAVHEATDTFRQQRRAEMGEVRVEQRHTVDRWDRYMVIAVTFCVSVAGWWVLRELGVR